MQKKTKTKQQTPEIKWQKHLGHEGGLLLFLMLSLSDYFSLGGGKHKPAFKAVLIFAAVEPLSLCLY